MEKAALCRSCIASWLRARELRKMLNIGGQTDRPETDVSRLSDAELVQQLSEQAKQLGVNINLNYAFLQQQKPDDEPQG
jgi:hypothetical protein